MAIKTESQIDRDFYSLIANSQLGKAIKGKIYRDEMRPADAKTEDIVSKFIAGYDEQIQYGIVVCNIYVPDIPHKGGKKIKDFVRIAELEEKIQALLESGGDYRLTTDGTPKTTAVEGLEQHRIDLRLKFQRLSD